MNRRLSALLAITMSLGVITITPLYAGETATRYEAEDATLLGNAKSYSDTSGVEVGANFSGTGYVSNLTETSDGVEFTINVEKAGRYLLRIGYAAPYGDKIQNIYTNNGQLIQAKFSATSEFTTVDAGAVKLSAGANKVKISSSWGWMLVDYIEVMPAEDIYIDTNVSAELINPNATKEAKAVMKYLTTQYGNHMISGQFAYPNYGTQNTYAEIDAIYKLTGKYPATIGLDMSDYSPARVGMGARGTDTEKAIDYWKNDHGLVSYCWHWGAPKDFDPNNNETKWGTFYTKNTTFDFSIGMEDHSSEEYELIIRDIDAIAVELKKLQDANVPILWRPLHEASGGWFWWGAQGSEPYIELWKLMYDRLVNYHGINNLIWIWNGQDSDWYPGDEYVDIVGEDIYADKLSYDSQINKFLEIYKYTNGKKMIALSENGVLPDPDELLADGAPWLFNCTWGGEFVVGWFGSTEYRSAYTSEAMANKFYNHDYVITRDELPESLFTSSGQEETVKVSVVGPEEGQIFDCSEAYIPILLRAQVEGVDEENLEFFVNGESVGKGNNAQWTPSGTTTTQDGLVDYKVVAQVTKEDGTKVSSSTVHFKVKLPIEALPMNVIIESSSKSKVKVGEVVTVSAKVEHSDQTDVTFYLNDELVATGDTYTFTPDAVGNYEVIATITSEEGEIIRSNKLIFEAVEAEVVTGNISVALSGGSSINSNTIASTFTLKASEGTFDLSKLAVRYYFTSDGASAQSAWVDNAAIQYNRAPWYVSMAGKVDKEVIKMSEPTDTADSYLEITFIGDEVLDQDATVSIATRVAKSDWSNYDQSNDYAYNDASKVVVLYDGVVVAGLEP